MVSGAGAPEKFAGAIVSRQSEKFLIGQSRKFLLTAKGWKDGTNRDEPRGTRQAGLVEASQGRGGEPAEGSREPGGERPLGPETVTPNEGRRRWRGGASTAGAGLQSENRGLSPSPGVADFKAGGLARLWADVCERATGE